MMNVNGKQLREVETAEGPAVDGMELLNALSSPTEEARRLLEEEQVKRVNRVAASLQEALEREKCVLQVAITITNKGNYPEIRIVPAELD